MQQIKVQKVSVYDFNTQWGTKKKVVITDPNNVEYGAFAGSWSNGLQPGCIINADVEQKTASNGKTYNNLKNATILNPMGIQTTAQVAQQQSAPAAQPAAQQAPTPQPTAQQAPTQADNNLIVAANIIAKALNNLTKAVEAFNKQEPVDTQTTTTYDDSTNGNMLF